MVYLWSLHMSWIKSFVKLWDLQKSLTSWELLHPDAFNHRQQVKNTRQKPTNQKVMTAGKVESCKIFIITFEVIMLLINGKNSSSNKWQFQSVFSLAILLSLLGSSFPSPMFPCFEVLRLLLLFSDWCKPLNLDLVPSKFWSVNSPDEQLVLC